MTSAVPKIGIGTIVTQQPTKVLKGAVILVLVILFILILVNIYQKVSGKKGKIKVPDAAYLPGGGNVSKVFLTNGSISFVAELEDTLLKDYSFWQDRSARCTTLKRLYETTNDNQLIVVHNLFKNNFKTTIRRLLVDKEDGCGVEWLRWGGGLAFADEYGELLLGRLNKLQLP